MKVNILVAGFQKCGTSALHEFLSNHPQIIGSNPKELDYFNYEEKFKKGNDYYHSFFNKKVFSAIRGFNYLESSPSYLSDRDVYETARRIKEYNNDVKIIGLIRNPAQRAYSAWNMYKERYFEGNKDWWINWVEQRTGVKPTDIVRRKEEEYLSFSLFVENEINVLRKGKKIECSILSHGEYHKGIQIYKEFFKDNFLILKNEDLNASTGLILNQIGDFLDLKEFNWNQFDGIKVFKGSYENKIQEETELLLSEYFLGSNKKLKEIIGFSY